MNEQRHRRVLAGIAVAVAVVGLVTAASRGAERSVDGLSATLGADHVTELPESLSSPSLPPPPSPPVTSLPAEATTPAARVAPTSAPVAREKPEPLPYMDVPMNRYPDNGSNQAGVDHRYEMKDAGRGWTVEALDFGDGTTVVRGRVGAPGEYERPGIWGVHHTYAAPAGPGPGEYYTQVIHYVHHDAAGRVDGRATRDNMDTVSPAGSASPDPQPTPSTSNLPSTDPSP